MAKDKDDDKKKKEPVRLHMVDTADAGALMRILGAVQGAFKDTPDVAKLNPCEIDADLYTTGILSLDKALGLGGILGGRIINCYGDAGTGKTLTGMMVAGAVQKAGGLVAYLDAEGTFSPKFAVACGIDVDKLIYVRSTPEHVMTGEDYFEVMKVLVSQGVNFILVDSGAALTPAQKFETKFGEGQQATQARLFSEELQKLTSYLSANQRTVLWFTNQIRSNPMAMFGPKDGSTAGKALQFYATYNFMMTKVEDLKARVKIMDGRDEEQIIGVAVKLFIKKNKTAALPVEPIQFDLYTNFFTLKDGTQITPGVNTMKDYFQVGKALGIIKQSSSWFYFGDLRGNGESGLCEALAQNPEAMANLRKQALGQMQGITTNTTSVPSNPESPPAEPE